MDQRRESLDRTEVGIEAKLLAHGQKALLRPHLGGGIVVVLRITYCSKKNGVTLQADPVSLFRIGRSIFVDRAGAGLGELVFHFVSETGADGVYGLLGLAHHFRSNAVSRQFSNLESHYLMFVRSRFSMMLSILTVALMAASVWSESMPRVLNSCPSMSQTMVVATRASVFPPGGMVT